ncbi:DUF6148 family protein [Viridibacillus arvi]|uniref:DUF6148 family protein n=1 Tax=Viridibacillus arvi TaxID=263475 RepID=UPI0034CEAD1A
MAFSREVVQERLEMWLKAEAAVATGQAYMIDNRKMERANLAEIRLQIQFWQKEESKLNRNGRRVMRIVPRDN